jgi:hypothetical protein
MHDGESRTPRSWRIIAEELSNETDTNRILELSRELKEALDQQAPRDGPQIAKPASTPAPSPPSKKASA